jgi:two-component system, OmpR family, sensor histidine kinase ChvG
LCAVVAMANEVKREDGVTVNLAFEGSPRIFRVQGHDSRLSQVMNNLIDNACSFSPPGGGTVRVTCRRSGREILITVDDDGPGIRPDAIEKIFERFYTDRPHQNFGQNSGLGLSISKQIVEAHDGRLLAQNRVAPREPGRDAKGDDAAVEERILGARFVVRLPAM